MSTAWIELVSAYLFYRLKFALWKHLGGSYEGDNIRDNVWTYCLSSEERETPLS